MILIADSGSTKTHWRLLKANTVLEYETIGLNPLFINSTILLDQLNSMSFDSKLIKEVYFYGAGCDLKNNKTWLETEFRSYFSGASIIELNSDLLGAARACYGSSKGLIGILGTGSNTAYYNGSSLEQTIPSLGYVLGDEGSGAYLGKLFLSSYFNKKLSSNLYQYIDLSKDEILNNIYSKDFPNTYLASFSKILFKYKKDPSVQEIIQQNFTHYVSNFINPYGKSQTLSIVGSVGYYFYSELKTALDLNGHLLAKVLQHPITELTTYHLDK